MLLQIVCILLTVCAAVGSAADAAKLDEQCGQPIFQSGDSGEGELVSHKEFAKCTYPVGLKCVWDILAKAKSPNFRLTFSFAEYEMPQETKPCSGSFLRAYAGDDTTKPAIKNLCDGRSVPVPFNSTTDKVRLVLQTSDIGAKGFILKWKVFSVPVNCDPVTQQKCSKVERCYDNNQKCNGISECEDGSDEVGCTPAICKGGEFRCSHGFRCIARTKLCDKSDDCGDNSDEKCKDCKAADDFRCLNKECVAKSKQCDIRDDCGDRSDEFQCTPEQECKSDLLRCNGDKNCADGSDEKGCPHESGGPPCLLNQVYCRTSKYCIKSSVACNGVDDCKDLKTGAADNSDEENCPGDACKEQWYQCANTQFITKSKVCDGTKHCFDNSDEKSCPSKPSKK